MHGYSITSPPLVVKDKVHRRHHRRRVRRARIPRRLRRRDRQAAVALVHASRARRIRQRHVERRQLEDWRRSDVADRLVRSGAQHCVLDRRQSRAADRSIRARRPRQPVQRFGRRARSRHRPAQVALPVHAERRPRLGLGAGRGPRRSRVARPDAEAAAARRSQRPLLRARPHERKVSVRHAVRLQNWNAGFDANGRPKQVPGSNSSREGSFLVYPTLGGATNFQAPSYSPLTGWFYLEYSESGQQYVSAPGHVRSGPAVHRTRRPRPATPAAPKPDEPAPSAGIKALDPETGKTMWDFKIVPGLADQRRAGDGGQRGLRRHPRRQPRRARREDRKAPLALPDRRQHGGVADQLRGGRPAVRRDRRRQHGLRFALPEVK